MTTSPFFKQIKSNVDRVGLHLFGIFGSEDSPPFTYTIGFAAHGLPEVIVFGHAGEDIVIWANEFTSVEWWINGERQ